MDWLSPKQLLATEEQPLKPWHSVDEWASASTAESANTEQLELTTVMLRNIPNKFTETKLLNELTARGFGNSFDFFYLPADWKPSKRQGQKMVANLGYCFINFTTPEEAERFRLEFTGLKLTENTMKVCEVTYAEVQGLETNIRHASGTLRVGARPWLVVDGEMTPLMTHANLADAVNRSVQRVSQVTQRRLRETRYQPPPPPKVLSPFRFSQFDWPTLRPQAGDESPSSDRHSVRSSFRGTRAGKNRSRRTRVHMAMAGIAA